MSPRTIAGYGLLTTAHIQGEIIWIMLHEFSEFSTGNSRENVPHVDF